MIPYCPSLAFYRGNPADPRHINRALFAGPLTLTVPVAGGAAALKRLARYASATTASAPEMPSLCISGHGNWPHRHLGSLEALYGRAPFFAHYYPPLAAIIASPPPLLADLNDAIDSLIRAWLRLPLPSGPFPSPVIAEARRLSGSADPQLSMLHYLFHLGPEAIFLLLKAF